MGNPGSEGRDPGVDPRVERLSTALAPAHHTHQTSLTGRAGLGQRAARVSLAGVPAPSHHPGTQHARHQLAPVHRVHGGAGRVGDDVHLHGQQPRAGLVGVLAGGPEARHRGERVDRRLEVGRGKTDGHRPAAGADTDWSPHCDHGDVILQGRLVELRVEDDLPDLPPQGRGGVGGVVLGQEEVHHAVEVALHPGQAVGGSEDVPVSQEAPATENTPGDGETDLEEGRTLELFRTETEQLTPATARSLLGRRLLRLSCSVRTWWSSGTSGSGSGSSVSFSSSCLLSYGHTDS